MKVIVNTQTHQKSVGHNFIKVTEHASSDVRAANVNDDSWYPRWKSVSILDDDLREKHKGAEVQNDNYELKKEAKDGNSSH